MEAVQWQPDGTPRSARFDDIYRPASGGLEQARHVFLHGCGLPQAWAGRAQWRILETGFGLGLNFLAAWQAWKDDPQRPRILHFVSVEAWPVRAQDLVRSAAAYPALAPLAHELASRWFGLTPGAHRLAFEQGRVLLTLHVRDARDMLRGEPFVADCVFLDGFDPQRNPEIWDEATLKAMARHVRRGTRLATWTASGQVRRTLAACGFDVHKAEGLPPKRHCTRAVFEPRWEPKGKVGEPARPTGRCIVIGAGLAGAAAAASLARRGWNVSVLDAGEAPAAGASGLPVGLLAPHTSPDDNVLSRLSRCGVRQTLQEARERLEQERDWRPTGALEIRPAEDPPRYPAEQGYADWQSPAHADDGRPATWHARSAWVRPAALVRAWLGSPGVEWHGRSRAVRLGKTDAGWQLGDSEGREFDADIVIVAAALGARELLGERLALNAVRGQIAWGVQHALLPAPVFPVNGNGHFIPGVPFEEGTAWYCGSTYGRGDEDVAIRPEDTRANLERLASLLPAVAAAIDPGSARAWAGVRCTSSDRRPLVGEIEPGLFVSTAMGSRGLTFCVLAAELLAARLHAEPLPLDARLAQAIDARR